MTDATNGSATLNADAGTPGAANGGNGEGSSGAAADPFAGLDAGTREWIGKAGVKDVAALAAKARNAESLIGRSVQLPAKDAKPEDHDAFLAKVLAPYRPEKAEGYDFKLPEGLPENMPYDQDFAAKFKAAAHSAGLTAKQSAALHDFYVKSTAEVFQKSTEATAAKAAAATKAVEEAWGGAVDSDAFKASANFANRALRELGGEDLQKAFTDAGLLGDGGVILNPAIAIAFAKIGKALFTEGGMDKGATAAAADNPFKDGPMGGNQTMMHKAIKEDRQKAISLIRAAGHKPEDWGIKDAA